MPTDSQDGRDTAAGTETDRDRGRARSGKLARCGDFPVISVLIVARNAGATIERAIESVVDQDHDGVETIILDAGSKDGTAEILRRRTTEIAYWRSAPDDGPVTATNEAISLVAGDVVCFLNADDWLEPGALRAVAQAFRRDPRADIVTGSARFVAVADDGTVRTLWRQPSRRSRLGWRVILDGAPVINARFFRRTVFERIGVFDDGIINPNDRDFLIRCLLAGVEERLIHPTVYTYRVHARSNSLDPTRGQIIQFRRDHVRLAERFLSMPQLPARARRRLQRWRQRELAHLVILECRSRRWPDARHNFQEGISCNFMFPLVILAQGIRLSHLKLRSMWRRWHVNVKEAAGG